MDELFCRCNGIFIEIGETGRTVQTVTIDDEGKQYVTRMHPSMIYQCPECKTIKII